MIRPVMWIDRPSGRANVSAVRMRFGYDLAFEAKIVKPIPEISRRRSLDGGTPTWTVFAPFADYIAAIFVAHFKDRDPVFGEGYAPPLAWKAWEASGTAGTEDKPWSPDFEAAFDAVNASAEAWRAAAESIKAAQSEAQSAAKEREAREAKARQEAMDRLRREMEEQERQARRNRGGYGSGAWSGFGGYANSDFEGFESIFPGLRERAGVKKKKPEPSGTKDPDLRFLRLADGAPLGLIEAAYRFWAMQVHPDKHPSEKRTWAEEKMKELNAVVERLRKRLG